MKEPVVSGSHGGRGQSSPGWGLLGWEEGYRSARKDTADQVVLENVR